MAVLKELILTVSTLQGCGSLERTDLTVSTLGGCSVLERPDFNNFYFGNVWQFSKKFNLTVSTFQGCVWVLKN